MAGVAQITVPMGHCTVLRDRCGSTFVFPVNFESKSKS